MTSAGKCHVQNENNPLLPWSRLQFNNCHLPYSPFFSLLSTLKVLSIFISKHSKVLLLKVKIWFFSSLFSNTANVYRTSCSWPEPPGVPEDQQQSPEVSRPRNIKVCTCILVILYCYVVDAKVSFGGQYRSCNSGSECSVALGCSVAQWGQCSSVGSSNLGSPPQGGFSPLITSAMRKWREVSANGDGNCPVSYITSYFF